MITFNDATFLTSEINRKFYIYMHCDPDDMLIKYIGITTLDEIFTFKDAKCNTLWSSIFGTPGKRVMIQIDSEYETFKDASVAHRKLVTQYQPHCNVRGYWIDAQYQKIICNETGEVFANLTECAKAHNLSLSALSNHVAGKPSGHKTVKGRTYRRSAAT